MNLIEFEYDDNDDQCFRERINVVECDREINGKDEYIRECVCGLVR